MSGQDDGRDDGRDDGPPDDDRVGGEVPPIDFTTFVLSLGTSALVHLGTVPGPDGEALPAELPLARQTIDVLALLEQKTVGNLTGEEERLLTQLLYDLRMKYLAAAKR